MRCEIHLKWQVIHTQRVAHTTRCWPLPYTAGDIIDIADAMRVSLKSRIGSFIKGKGYASHYDCAKLVNLFEFGIARLHMRSIFINYVPSDSNIADIPSRFFEPPKSEDPECWEIMGTFITSIIPALADHTG